MEKKFDSILEVNTAKIAGNYDIMRSKLAKNTECGAVVKANGYGLGMIEASKAISNIGCKNFFVAYVDEAIELRKHFPKINIYIFHGIQEESVEISAKENFIPSLNDFYQIELWNKHAAKLGKKLPAIIHFDTGMSRLGLSQAQVHMLVEHPEMIENIEVKYIMSHLACADEPEHELNQKQLELLKKYSKMFPGVKISFPNSAGMMLGKEYHSDMARPGCSLYGINPIPSGKSPVQQVATLKARVLQIRNIEEDQPVSYGAKHIAKKGSRLATLACGYADGYHRILTGNTAGYFERYRVPIVGTVTMDMVMADVTEVPENLLGQMKYVGLLGDHITVDEVADRAQTIGYEVLTSLGNRFKRVYL